MNALTIHDAGTSVIEDRIRLRDTRPFRTENRPFLAAKKSLFNRVVAEAHAGGLELSFAAFLEEAADVVSFAKNYLAVGFKLDYVKADGDLPRHLGTRRGFLHRHDLRTTYPHARFDAQRGQHLCALRLACECLYSWCA